jgi:hydroxypyruvate isomerase
VDNDGMLRFCANISTLFTDRPLLQRFAAAREAGFAAVEIQFPYAEPAHGRCATTA